MADYDIIGNIALIKAEGKSKSAKLKQAKKLLQNSNINTVLEKVGNIHGRLRTITVKHVLGEKNLIAIHHENGCIFKFNISRCYFSPRLSEERKKIASKIRKKDNVLIMFSGVGPFPIIIAKKGAKVTSIELSRECNKYAKENMKLNHVNVRLIQGDVKKKMPKEKFDVVVMARPNLRESFLKQGLSACKKGSRIFYYGFCNVDEINGLKNDLKKEAEDFGRKIKIMKVVKAGDIAPYKFRWRIEIKVLK